MVRLTSLAVLAAALLPCIFGAPVQNEEKRDVTIEAVPGSYIITLKSGLNARDLESHLGWVNEVHARSLGRREFGGVKKTYTINTFHGYAGSFDAATIEVIKNSPQVCFSDGLYLDSTLMQFSGR
jgi:oryzin